MDARTSEHDSHMNPVSGDEDDENQDDEYFNGVYEPFDDEKFLEIISEIPDDDPSMAAFKTECEKLRSSLAIASDKERMLLAKCSALSQECRAQAAKMTLALNLSQEDQSTIDALKNELEKAWTTVDEAHESELASKRAISELKMEIERLTHDDDSIFSDTTAPDSFGDRTLAAMYKSERASVRRANSRELESLLSAKESLTSERDELLEQTIKLREDIDKLSERTRQAESTKLELDVELQNAQDAAHASEAEVERQKRMKDQLERELSGVKERSAERENEIRDYKVKVAKTDELIIQLEKDVRLQERRAEAAQKELNMLASKSDKLHRELDEARLSNKNAADANTAKMHEIRALNDELKQTEREKDKLSKQTVQLSSKLRAAEQSKMNAEESKNTLKREVQLLEQRLEQQKRDLDNEQRRKDDLLRERDVLLKTTTQAQNASSRQQDLLRIHEAQRQTLENEIKSYKIDQAKQDMKLKLLDQQRSQLQAETAEAAALQEKLEDEVREREAQIVELQQELHEAELKIKHAEHTYDVVRTERNQQSKALLDAQAQIAEVKQNFKTKTMAMEVLQEELRAKEAIIAGERFEHRKLDKEQDALRRQYDKLNATLRETQDGLKNANEDSKTLRISLASLNDSRATQRKQLEIIKRDRDVLNAQLVQRNQECALLYEKVKIQQKILNQGQSEYRERVRDIKVLKLRLTSHTQELTALREAATSIDALKQEVQTLERELLHERTKVKALSEELENPMNVHRWRQLKGSDPTMYELIQKVQTLQRRLIAKTEEVTENEILISEKSKVLEELRVVLARQPGPSAFEALRDTQVQIKEKTRQIKGLQSELKMFIAHRDAYTHELGMLHDELAILRKKSGQQYRFNILQA